MRYFIREEFIFAHTAEYKNKALYQFGYLIQCLIFDLWDIVLYYVIGQKTMVFC